tara:strand:+ start:97067 stop:97177 length:111 start_codon:yes stop_codon:yes gene_type:complete
LGDGSWEMGACGLPVPNEVGRVEGWGVADWKIGVME